MFFLNGSNQRKFHFGQILYLQALRVQIKYSTNIMNMDNIKIIHFIKQHIFTDVFLHLIKRIEDGIHTKREKNISVKRMFYSVAITKFKRYILINNLKNYADVPPDKAAVLNFSNIKHVK